MSKQAINFESLNICSPQWETARLGAKCAYDFTVHEDGVLVLKTAGIVRKEDLSNQVNFINNYVLRVHEKIAHFQIILIWDISSVFGIKSFKFIQSQLRTIQADMVLFVSSSVVVHFIFNGVRFFKKDWGYLFFPHITQALIFATKMHSTYGSRHNYSGRFFELWAHSLKTLKINNQRLKYVELPHWTYHSDDYTLEADVRYFDGNILYVKTKGILCDADVYALQQVVFQVGEDLNIDFTRFRAYVIFDIRKLGYLTKQARQLIRLFEDKKLRITNAVFVIANSMVRFNFLFQKTTKPSFYEHWYDAKSVRSAFAMIDKHRIGELNVKIQSKTHPIPDDYNQLKKAYIKLNSKLVEAQRKHDNSNTQVRRVLSIVNTGDLLNAPISPDYRDHRLAAEVLNSLFILKNDLIRRLKAKVNDDLTYGFNQSNIKKLINTISDPLFIFQDGQIWFANQRLEKFLQRPIHAIEGQRIGAIANPFEVSRVERFLTEFNSQDSIKCELLTNDGYGLQVSLISEMIVIDGKSAQMVFVHSLTPLTLGEQLSGINKVFEVSEDVYNLLINKSVSTFLNFHNHLVSKIEERVNALSTTISEQESFVNSNVLLQSSVFLKRALDGVGDLKNRRNASFYIDPAEFLPDLYKIFTDFLCNVSSKQNTLQLKEIQSCKLMLPLHEFFIRAIMVKLFLLLVDVVENEIVVMDFEKPSKHEAVFLMYLNKSAVNLYASDRYAIGAEDLQMEDIETLMKMAGSNLFVSEKSGALQLSLHFPIVSHGLGYGGITSNFSQYNILVVVENDFEIIQKALESTQANLIHAQYIFDALHANYDQISLVLVDLHIQQTDISEYIRRVKQLKPTLPVVGIASFMEHKEWKKSRSTMADAIVSKPIDVDEVRQVMIKLLS